MFKFLILFLCFQLSASGATLQERISAAAKLDKPILTVFSAKWCGPCQSMKNGVIEPMRASGELEPVTLLTVDVDADKAFAEKHLGKDFRIPKILLFFKKDGKWFKYELTGYQSKEKILQLIELTKKR